MWSFRRACACALPVFVRAALAGPLLVVNPASAGVVADSADDVCAASAEPCVVAQPVEVVAGSRLDFGLRTLRIQDSGLLDFAAGDTELLCGRLEIATGGVAVRAQAGDSIGTVALRVRRRCSLGPATPCFVDADCEVVAGGSCSEGDGEAILDGAIHGSADNPGRVVVKSAGRLSLLAAAVVTGTRTVSDGGIVELESTGGSVVVAAPVDVSGGGGGSGGEFLATAADDVEVHDTITANGGEYDGGSITLEAGRDVTITDDVRADSVSGAGVGGEVAVGAGRDLTIAGGTPSNKLVVGSDGHQSADNFGGDGGTQSFEAGRDLVVSRDVRFDASGAPPDGFADSLSFSAEGDIRFDAGVVARGRGASGGGALVDIVAQGDIHVATSASFDLTGPVAGGDLMIEGDGALTFAGVADVSGGPGGIGGRVVAVAAGDAEVSGRWVTAGARSTFSVGDLYLEACQVRVSGPLANAAVAGRNRIVAHDGLEIAAAGSVAASGDGSFNSFRYRRAARPPLVEGSVSPAPSFVLDSTLSACAVCGNAEQSDDESCDDGNLTDGDGCSSRCQDEGCEAATPGYPVTALCDDANVCTDDACDGNGACVHAANTLPCEDRDLCSTGGVCVDGSCETSSAPSLAVTSLRSRTSRVAGRNRGNWKVEFPSALLAVAPPDTRLRVVLLDRLSRPLFDSTLAAGAFRGSGGAWRYKAAADPDAVGVVKAAIVVDSATDVARARFKLRGLDLAEAAEAGSMSLALVFGDEPGTAPCTSSADLVCQSDRRKVTCSSTP